MKLVRDIMTPLGDYVTVHERDPLIKAIELLKKSFCRDEKGVVLGHRSLLVLNDHQELVGILTIRTILSAVESVPIGFSWADFFAEPDPTGLQMPVREVMRYVMTPHVNADDRVDEAIHTLLRGKVNILPVLEKGKVVGIVRSIDFFELLGEILAT
ncbi:MAG: CBS domain-containing protein [Bacillota bacterium]